jgi:hypothetical protein
MTKKLLAFQENPAPWRYLGFWALESGREVTATQTEDTGSRFLRSLATSLPNHSSSIIRE